ncbi:response regulator [Roseateles sp.]|uniref:response regulator n=1 Tax=Roseateles sp. TaxID=1971397 RepID=UPI003263A116
MDALCILVVDDHEVNLLLAECVLEADGMEVLRAGDAESARVALRARQPDLILLDIQLPGVDGLSLAREFKADARLAGVPVIAFTAHAMRGDEARFCAAGFDGYLAKPIEVTRFARQVRDFVAS